MSIKRCLFRKKTILSLSAMLIFTTSAHAGQNKESLADLLKGRPITMTDKLVVNTENKVRYAARITEKKGIKDLFSKVYTSRFEEGYSYIRPLGFYIEIGINEETKETYKGVEFEDDTIKKLYMAYGNLINIHIHPTRGVKQPKKITSKVPRRSWDYLEMMPSFEDLTLYITRCRELYKEKEGNITDRIQSKFGITEYFLTKKGKTYFSHMSNAEIASYAAKKADMLKNISPDVKDIETIVNVASNILNDRYLRWNFTSYKKLFN